MNSVKAMKASINENMQINTKHIYTTLRQLSQTWKLRHYDVIDDVITRKV